MQIPNGACHLLDNVGALDLGIVVVQLLLEPIEHVSPGQELQDQVDL
jgi:hypothetical protein